MTLWASQVQQRREVRRAARGYFGAIFPRGQKHIYEADHPRAGWYVTIVHSVASNQNARGRGLDGCVDVEILATRA
jgi:hypothetical protein